MEIVTLACAGDEPSPATRSEAAAGVATTTAAADAPGAPALDAASVHASHGEFIWLNLQRLGVWPADLDDQLQEVLVVVHRRAHTFDGRTTVSSWLFGVCARVAAAYRRRAYVRRERPVAAPPERESDAPTSPEQHAAEVQARAALRAMLDEMDLEKRAVFVMFEIEELECEQIAAVLGVPVGTVYSRLHAARKQFHAIAARWKARHEGPRLATGRGGATR